MQGDHNRSLSNVAVLAGLVGSAAVHAGDLGAQTRREDQVVTTDQVEQLLREMDDALAKNDLERMVGVFTPDATVESPLTPRLLNRKEGICRGREEIRVLVRALMQKGRHWGTHTPPLIRGNTVAIEYMSKTSDTEPVSVDFIDLRDGKIHRLRAYLGWRAMAAFSNAAKP